MHTHAQDESNHSSPVLPSAESPERGQLRRFSESERLALLRLHGIGPIVVSRLEALGIVSFAKLREIGTDRAVQMVCEAMGSPAWKNRQTALERALAQPTHQGEVRLPGQGSPPT